MSRPARPLALVLLAFAAACSDGGSGPETSSNRIVVLQDVGGQQSIWEYGAGSPRRLTPDSVRFIRAMARAEDGRLAYLELLTASASARVVELAPSGAALRALAVSMPDLGYHRPAELAYSPDGARLAWHIALGSGADSLYVLDAGATAARGIAVRPAQQAMGARLVPAPPMRWTPSQRLVFGPAGSLVAFQVAGHDTLTLASGEGYIRDYDIAADGRLAIVSGLASQSTARLRAQRVAGGALVQVVGSAAADPVAVRWTKDGRRLATTVVDSVLHDGQWSRLAIPYLMELDNSVAAVRAQGVTVSAFDGVIAFHGWTDDGRLIVTGPQALPPTNLKDVYLASFGGSATNVTRTPNATEVAAIPAP